MKDAFAKLLSWRWGPGGKLGLGAFLGIVLIVIPSVVFISLDFLKVTRQVEPPPFLEDFVPDRHQVCSSAVELVDQVQLETSKLNAIGWPKWPTGDKVEVVDCGIPHQLASDGYARWHLCTDMRDENGIVLPGCTSKPGSFEERGGMTIAHVEDGHIRSVDMYINIDFSGLHTVLHEQLHGRGMLVTPDDDLTTPYVQGAHTEKPGHILNEDQSGEGMKWLDRRKDGDWPYALP